MELFDVCINGQEAFIWGPDRYEAITNHIKDNNLVNFDFSHIYIEYETKYGGSRDVIYLLQPDEHISINVPTLELDYCNDIYGPENWLKYLVYSGQFYDLTRSWENEDLQKLAESTQWIFGL